MTDAIQALSAGNVDPYLLATLQTYNPNFKGTQNVTQTSATQVPQVQQSASVATNAGVTNLPQADYSEAPDSSTGSVLGLGAIAIGAGALIIDQVACKGKHRKKLWDKLTGMFGKGKDAVTEAAKEATKSNNKKLENLVVKYAKNGKVEYYVPGKTETINDANRIKQILESDKEFRRLSGLRFKTGETSVTSGTFDIKTVGHNYTVEFSRKTNGEYKIKSILDAGGKNSGKPTTEILIDKDGKIITSGNTTANKRATEVEEMVTKILNGDTETIMSKETNLRDFVYKTRIGDNVAEFKRSAISIPKDKTIGDVITDYRSLTRLKALQKGSKDLEAYLYDAKKAGRDISAITEKKFLDKGNIPEGFKIGTMEITRGKDKILVRDNEIVSISIDGGKPKFANSTDYKAYLQNHEEEIRKTIEKINQDKKIPKGVACEIIPA